jgi:glycosyltransferase involved in cell wall biosynthesis
VGHLVSALLVKNEASRYLERVIKRCAEFSDDILVLDDRSSDNSVELAKRLGCKVRGRSVLKGDAWGNEAPARAELWDWMAAETKDGWGLIVDADMLLKGNPRNLLQTWELNTFCFILYDIWDESETLYRTDGHWKAHDVARPWLFRPSFVPEGWKPRWGGRGIHIGHAPSNWSEAMLWGVAPPDEYHYLHLAYCKPQDRVAKYHKYMEVKDQLSPFELEHARSIIA